MYIYIGAIGLVVWSVAFTDDGWRASHRERLRLIALASQSEAEAAAAAPAPGGGQSIPGMPPGFSQASLQAMLQTALSGITAALSDN